METNGKLPPVSRRKSKLDPISPDLFRRTQSSFGGSDNSKAIQALLEENDRLKKELEAARKEIFELKQENVELKKDAKPGAPKVKPSFSNPTSLSTFEQNGQHEENNSDVK
jgi:predicted  nucleic acid-binding Zn-ribbon protein